MRQLVEDLKERPKKERIAFATTITVGVVIALLCVWVLFFVRTVKESSATLENVRLPQAPFESIE